MGKRNLGVEGVEVFVKVEKGVCPVCPYYKDVVYVSFVQSG